MSKNENVTIIRDDRGAPVAAVLPWSDYQRLRAGGDEDAMLIAAGNAARNDERFPAEVADRLIAGEVPLKVFREWRGLSQGNLGKEADVPAQYISQIERGARGMGRKTAEKIAPVLGVSVAALLDI